VLAYIDKNQDREGLFSDGSIHDSQREHDADRDQTPAR
jgi:hypothetical protein